MALKHLPVFFLNLILLVTIAGLVRVSSSYAQIQRNSRPQSTPLPASFDVTVVYPSDGTLSPGQSQLVRASITIGPPPSVPAHKYLIVARIRDANGKMVRSHAYHPADVQSIGSVGMLRLPPGDYTFSSELYWGRTMIAQSGSWKIKKTGRAGPSTPSPTPTPTATPIDSPTPSPTSTPTATPSGGSQPNSTADIKVYASTVVGTNPHLERDRGYIYQTRGPNDAALLSAIHTHLLRGFWRANTTTGGSPGQYDFTGGTSYSINDGSLTVMASYGASPVISVYGQPTWDGGAAAGAPTNMPAWQAAVHDTLEHFKTVNDFIYFEVGNEPDLQGWSTATYAQVYHYAALAVAQINTDITNGANGMGGKQRVKIGGPVVSNSNNGYIDTFLTNAHNNGDPVDFVSWHPYNASFTGPGSGPNPVLFQTETAWIKSDAASHGYPNVETLSTEWSNLGPNTGTDANGVANVAAYAAAAEYYQYLAGVTHTFFFADLDYAVPSSSTLDCTNDGNPCGGTDGTWDPVYGLFKEMSMMKDTIVSATSSGLDSSGNGMGAWASADGSTVSVLIWNQGATGSTHSLSIGSLPFGGSYQVKQYLVDNTHSNYRYNGDQTLDLIANFSTSAQPYNQDVTLTSSAASLIVLSGQ